MKGFSNESNWEFFTLGIPLSKNKCNNHFCSKRIDDEVPLKVWANEDWSYTNFPFDIIERFLCINGPFKTLVPF